LEQKGELARAEAIYRSALEAEPGHPLAAHRLAVIADRRGQFAQSAWYFEQALWNQPDNADVRCDLGYSLYRQEKWEEAEAQLRLALEADPQHQRANNNYGLLLARSGRADQALASFRQAGCGATEARMNLAFALASSGQVELAQRQLDEARRNLLASSAVKERMEQLQQWIDLSAVAVAARPSSVPSSAPSSLAPSEPEPSFSTAGNVIADEDAPSDNSRADLPLAPNPSASDSREPTPRKTTPQQRVFRPFGQQNLLGALYWTKGKETPDADSPATKSTLSSDTPYQPVPDGQPHGPRSGASRIRISDRTRFPAGR
jgi:hypothetical protein